LRICFLDQKERTEDCGKKCEAEHKDCCADLDKIPDSSTPGGVVEVPPFIAWEIPSFEAVVSQRLVIDQLGERYSQPIRGPDSPSTFRSVLSIWRI